MPAALLVFVSWLRTHPVSISYSQSYWF